jgi:type II secretory pathway pseudopilin PulG
MSIFKTKKNNIFAFTLAETLISIVIIGVIATITIPVLYTKHQKEQTVSSLKKVYSTISRATFRAVVDNGPVDSWTLGSNNNANATKQFLNTYMIPYMSVYKPPTTKSEGKWNNVYYNLNSNDKQTYPNYSVRFYFNDGTSVTARNETNRCIMDFDINGDRNPNKMGRDIFQFNFYINSNIDGKKISGELLPNGAWETRDKLLSTSLEYGCNRKRKGHRCSAVIMKDGWQIKSDYPW